ncbi:MAG TPA: hypothetical protein VFV66_21665 [Nonomuraea sp.]|nr:hypothetical protein [Nonomuraea sp.]
MTTTVPEELPEPPTIDDAFIGPPRVGRCVTCDQVLATPHRHRDDWAVHSCPHPSDVPVPLVDVHVEMHVTEEVQHQFAVKVRVPIWAAGHPDILHSYLDAREDDWIEDMHDDQARQRLIERTLDTLYLLDAGGRRVSGSSERP